MSKRNAHRKFDQRQGVALGVYVYALWDPRDRKVFYVGQGTGSRVFEHFDEADEETQLHTAKNRRITEIWAEDLDVGWTIVRHNLQSLPTTSLSQADHVEAAIIDALGVSQNGPPLNEVRGAGVDAHGMLSEEHVAALAAPPIDPSGSYSAVFIFPIHNAIAEGKNVYDATRMAWRVSDENQNLQGALAVGLNEGVSRGVFTIERWQRAQASGKHEFCGQQLNESELLNKRWLSVLSSARGYWQRGNYLIVEFDGKHQFRFIRGARDSSWFALL